MQLSEWLDAEKAYRKDASCSVIQAAEMPSLCGYRWRKDGLGLCFPVSYSMCELPSWCARESEAATSSGVQVNLHEEAEDKDHEGTPLGGGFIYSARNGEFHVSHGVYWGRL